MMDPVAKLVYELSKLPGIGEKSATRLTYFILKQDRTYAESLAQALVSAKSQIGLCQSCFTFTDLSPCRICADLGRDQGAICVVEKPSDVPPIESSGVFRGLYHVLHGVLSPLDGIGPDELKIAELMKRLKSSEGRPIVSEVILATNPSVEGESTAHYLSRLLKPLGLKVTQLAYGIPMGGTLEYTDKQTIGKALSNRQEVGG